MVSCSQPFAIADALFGGREVVCVILNPDEAPPSVEARHARRPRTHAVVENEVTRVRVGADQVFAERDRLLRRVQLRPLFVAGELKDGARITLGAVVGQRVESLFSIDRRLVAPLRRGLPDVALRLDRVVCRLAVIEDQHVFVRLHRGLLGVQVAGGVGLLPNPLVFETTQVADTKHLVEGRLCEQHDRTPTNAAVFGPQRG